MTLRGGLFVVSLLAIVCLTAGEVKPQNSIPDALLAGEKLALEGRKIELEEQRLYLDSIRGSKLTEQKAREISESILQRLKGYPQGKKAIYRDQDVRFLVTALTSIEKSVSN